MFGKFKDPETQIGDMSGQTEVSEPPAMWLAVGTMSILKRNEIRRQTNRRLCCELVSGVSRGLEGIFSSFF